MVDPIYPIPGNPVYSPEIRALQDGDPARASTVFNPVLEKIISNTHAVKLAGDALAKSVKALAEAASQPGDASHIVLPDGKTVTAAISDIETRKAGLASPTFTGTPKAPTPGPLSNDTSIATTAFVKGQGSATTDSPAFTGTPTAPTPANGDNSAKLATTAFVKNQDYIPSADKGKASGIASLGADGKVLTSQLPDDIDCGTF